MRVSCCFLLPKLCLIRVDAPICPAHDILLPRPELRLPVGLNRGGLKVPCLYEGSHPSLFEALQQFFAHPWHFHILFAQRSTDDAHISPETFFHLLASSTWAANLRILDQNIRRLAFDEIQRPNLRTTDDLHRQRRDLTTLLSEVNFLLKWLSPDVKSELTALKDTLPASKYIGYPDVILQDILENGNNLEKFLMDTFTLLLSTISVVDAEATKEQGRRTQMLTKLAFVYVPLSFVTGVFGMNVKEINGSQLSIWTSVVVLCVTGVSALVLFMGYDWLQSRKSTNR
ncbi:hypothetical protein CBER1_11380 [Cercospora berteroae]|uniref:Uncharacterized protein n=1 Tax=Cercospora berteroae TaxID=357750 RepID=A0A2S6CJM4_9PEZI|nr:hypothetical protein CBER1_11380 [Cercospora berteroae]